MRDYLLNVRKRTKQTLRQVAEKMSITEQAYSHIEKGVRQTDMTLTTIERLASAYDMTPEEIMHLEQDYRAQRDTA